MVTSDLAISRISGESLHIDYELRLIVLCTMPRYESYLSHTDPVVLALNPFFVLECVLLEYQVALEANQGF